MTSTEERRYGELLRERILTSSGLKRKTKKHF